MMCLWPLLGQKADSRIRTKCALLGQTCHMFLLYLQPKKNRPFWCFRNIIFCSVRRPPHVCTLGALECADRAIAEFMLSTPGTNRQSSLAQIGTLNKHIRVSGGQTRKRLCHTHCTQECLEQRGKSGDRDDIVFTDMWFTLNFHSFTLSLSLSHFLLHTEPQLFDKTYQLGLKLKCCQVSDHFQISW